MITGRAVSGAKDYAKRHLKANDYYEKNKEIQGHWIGAACEQYGVKAGGVVDEKAFEALTDNKHAVTGEQITLRKNTKRIGPDGKLVDNRRSFYDFTFSAPKSFSILAVTCKNNEVKNWHDTAVTKALKEMEKWTGRQDHSNPSSRVETTGKFVAAMYQHDSNRALEPNLHDHVVIFNMTPSSDSRSYAIESREYFDRVRYLTAIYRDELAHQAIQAGMYVEFDKHGAPQIKTKEQSLLGINEKFSSRSTLKNKLIAKCEELIGSTLTNNEVTLLVRNSRGLNEELFDQEMANLELTGSRLEIINEYCNRMKDCSNSRLVETTTEEVLKAQWEKLSMSERELLKEAEKIIDGVIKDENPLPSLRENFKASLKHCFERKSVVFDYELYEVILRSCCGKGVPTEALNTLTNQFIKSNHNPIVKIGTEITTLKHLQREQSLIKWVAKGKEFFENVPSSFLPSEKLNLEQYEAVLGLVRSEDQFKVLVGKAGTGKTFALSEIVRAYVENDTPVYMFSPSNGSRDVLREDGRTIRDEYGQPNVAKSFLEAESLQMLLKNPEIHQNIPKNSLVVLDEAGLASMEQMHAFCKMAFYNQWNVQLCGDPRQHTSVEAGDALRIMLKNTRIERKRLKSIQRQRPEQYKKAAVDFASGQTNAGFDKLDKMGSILEAKGNNFAQTIAEHYLDLYDPKNKNSAIVVTPTHREIDAVSDTIRRYLKQQGKLKKEQPIESVRSLGWTYAQRRDYRNYHPGMVLTITSGKGKGNAWEVLKHEPGSGIRCRNKSGEETYYTSDMARRVDVCEKKTINLAPGDLIMNRFGIKRTNAKEIINGETLTFKGLTPEGYIETQEGKTLTHRNFTYGYASTSHKSQGGTYENVIIGFDRNSIKNVDQKLAYVAATRGKQNVHLIVENKDDLKTIESRPGTRKSALELIEQRINSRSLREGPIQRKHRPNQAFTESEGTPFPYPTLSTYQSSWVEFRTVLISHIPHILYVFFLIFLLFFAKNTYNICGI